MGIGEKKPNEVLRRSQLVFFLNFFFTTLLKPIYLISTATKGCESLVPFVSSSLTIRGLPYLPRLQ